MFTSAPPNPTAPATSLRSTKLLSLVIALLGALTAAGGLFLPDLYRDTEWAAMAIRGQDLFTLAFAVPAILTTLLFVKPGALRAKLVLAGLMGYLFYTYTGGIVGFAFNRFFLLYVLIFAGSAAAIVRIIAAIDVPSLVARFDAETPRRAVGIFLIVMGAMLAMMELGQIIPFMITGELPAPVALAGGIAFFPYGLDLGMVLPLMILAAVWLWRREPWGYLLTSFMLIKSVAMGFALLGTNLYSGLMGGLVDPVELLAVYALIGLGSLGMGIWFFRHCRS